MRSMRIRRRLADSASRAAAVIAAGVASGVVWLSLAGSVLGDSPTPSQPVAGDPRAGQAPGFVGDPGLAILIVALIVVVSAAATLAWVRATGGARHAEDDRP